MNQDPGLPFAAAHDKAAPFNQPQLDPREQREIARKADELAGEAFTKRKPDADEWIRDNLDLPEVEELIWLGICIDDMPLDPDVSIRHSKAVEHLREIYIKQCAHIYRAEAEREIMETAEEES